MTTRKKATKAKKRANIKARVAKAHVAKAHVAEASRPYRVRKNMAIDPIKLSRARKVLGVTTETAAVDRALDSVVAGEEVIAAMERAFVRGGFRGMGR